MSDRTIMFPLPETAPKDLEQRINSQVAGEMFIWQDMILHFDLSSNEDEDALEAGLNVIDQFTDETLWSILDYRVPYPQRQRRRELIDKFNRSREEETELDHLMEIYDRFVLVRSQALLSLKQRGYDMDRYLQDQNL
jgi:hypothetical protein